ncbi:hypothetical protein RRG08_023029 [Elysia crispata]|uniref:Uncharacterized protein n=1 Tax=Elysia crispata TaxID=231223 RepID=A0AAE0YNF2_9GAST|nr:hypothetical protein RRG08_023029 [Elysia crispata]
MDKELRRHPDDDDFGHTNVDSPVSFTDNIRLRNFRTEATGGGGTIITPGGNAETSFSTGNIDAYGNPMINTLYDKSTRDGSAFDTKADVHNLPDTPLHNPSTEPGGNIGNLRDKLAADAAEAKAKAAEAEAKAKAAAEAAKIALVNEFYQSNAKDYGFPLPEKIPYDQFDVGEDGKTVYWNPEEGKVIPLRSKKGGGFLALSTLASNYGKDGIDAIRTSMGLKDYNSKTRKLSPKVQENIQHARDILPAGNVDITPVVAEQADESSEIAIEALDEQLTPEQSAALDTIDDPPLDLHGGRLCGGLAGGRL